MLNVQKMKPIACGHRIKQQCYLCPEGSTNIEYMIVLGNYCLTKWGYEAAIRGKGVKDKCEYCEANSSPS